MPGGAGGPPSLPDFVGKVSVNSKGVEGCVLMWAQADMFQLSKYSKYVTKYCPVRALVLKESEKQKAVLGIKVTNGTQYVRFV